jgi:hypothetical protein
MIFASVKCLQIPLKRKGCPTRSETELVFFLLGIKSRFDRRNNAALIFCFVLYQDKMKGDYDYIFFIIFLIPQKETKRVSLHLPSRSFYALFRHEYKLPTACILSISFRLKDTRLSADAVWCGCLF